MEVWLVVAVVAVGASALFVAATFNSRTRRTANPLIQQASQDITSQVAADIKKVDTSLRGQLQTISGTLSGQLQGIDRGLTGNNLLATRIGERLDRADSQISDIHGQIMAERQGVKTLTEQIARLNAAVVQQGTQVSGIESYLESKKELSAADITSLQEALRDMGERQSRTQAEMAEIANTVKSLMTASDEREDRDRQVAEQLLDLTEMLLHGQRDIESYLRARLDYEVVRTSRDHEGRIITADLYLDRPGADILWPLCLQFCESIMLRALLPERPRPAGCGSYLIWQPSDDQQQLEEILGAKLAACPDNLAWPSPGLEELRALTLLLHHAGPGTAQLGPLIINRTQRASLGCVLTAAEMARITSMDALTSADACEVRLLELGHDRVVNLTSWADAMAQQMLPVEEPEAPGQPG